MELNPALWARAVLGMPLDATQERILLTKPHRLILNCHRQWGKSTVTAVLAAHRVVFNPGVEVICVSRTQDQSAEWLRKVERMLRQLGLKVRGDGFHKRCLVLPNGSRLIALAGVPENNRGYAKVSLMIFEEASRVKPEMYWALRPSLGVSDGDLFLISTPCGQDGVFYQDWMFGEDWTRVMVTAEESGRISRKFLERERRANERAYRQDYLCEFLEAEDAWIDRDTVERAFRKEIKPLEI